MVSLIRAAVLTGKLAPCNIGRGRCIFYCSMHNIAVIAGQAMTEKAEGGSGGQPTKQNNSEAAGVSRREALGRFGAYTAPALLALLVSEKAVAATDAATQL
jgi:hypothetical protein